MKSIFKAFFLSLCIIANTHFAFSQTASILPQGYTQYLDANGKPLASGKVYNYIPSTTTFKTTWQDSGETIANTNPVILDGSGRAKILGDGNYRQIVKDRNNNIIWDANTSSTGSGSGGGSTATGDGDLVGTIKPWAGNIAPNQYMFTYGQEISRTTYSALYTAIAPTQPIFCSSGSAVLTGLSDTNSFWIGMTLEVSCLASGNSTIISKTASTVTMAANANTTTSATARFFPWGRGNGVTTFNLPDFRGIVPAGNNIMGGVSSSNLTTTYFGATDPNSAGALGGSQSTTFVQANLPSVNFAVTGNTGTITSTSTVSDVLRGNVGGAYNPGATFATSTNMTANTITSTGSGTISGNAASGGSSTPFSRVQPTRTVNYIIKVTPDTSSATATGVTSIQSMVGDIACGTGLTCTANIMSVNTSSIPLVIGGSTITSGTTTRVLYDNAGILGEYPISGTVAVAMTNSPILVTPTLGAAIGTSIALGGCTIGSNVFCVTGTSALGGATTITSTSSNSLAVGPNGTTNPTFSVDASTASAATGLLVKSAAAAAGLAVSVLSSGTNENLAVNAKGSGTISIGNTSTGNVALAGGGGTVTANGNTVTVNIASGTSALGTSAISSGACATVVTTSATGTATTDVVDFGFNGDPTGTTGYVAPNMLSIIAYPSANNVNFKVCNNTSGSITPGAITLNWKIRR